MTAEICERCGDECSEMETGLCCDCIRDRCVIHSEERHRWK